MRARNSFASFEEEWLEVSRVIEKVVRVWDFD